MFLSGYFVPSGNLARQSIESLAFASLLPFPATGAYKKWKAGHADEYKAVGNLARNAKHTGMIKDNVHNLSEQAKWFDQFSHASRIGLATIFLPPNDEYPEGVWNVGAVFVEDYLEQYRKEMSNRISLTDLLSNAIAGTHAALIEKKLIDLPDGVAQIV
uniref:Uncharacterized protein n=1 Tax=mine drainage metagenome TaxID=410659 RepID=E6QQ32_9ZZZZ